MEMKVICSIKKPKLPKDYCYVLQSSQLDDLLFQSGLFIHTDLVFWLPQKEGTIFEAHYWLPKNQIEYPRLYVRAGALLKENAVKAKTILEIHVLPAFCIWFKDILNLPYNSSRITKDIYFNAEFKNNDVVIFHIPNN